MEEGARGRTALMQRPFYGSPNSTVLIAEDPYERKAHETAW
jgi:hypothetical protein